MVCPSSARTRPGWPAFMLAVGHPLPPGGTVCGRQSVRVSVICVSNGPLRSASSAWFAQRGPSTFARKDGGANVLRPNIAFPGRLLAAVLVAACLAIPLTSAPAAAAAVPTVVWGWGINGGDGPVRPMQVNGLTGVTSVSGGDRFALAMLNDGTIWGWGYNGAGQLGDGTRTDRPTPVQVSGLSGVTAVAAGSDDTLALKNDGTVWTWVLPHVTSAGTDQSGPQGMPTSRAEH